MMKAVELNSYIKRYLEEDKTNTAIMLTGEWGQERHITLRSFLFHFYKEKKRIISHS